MACCKRFPIQASELFLITISLVYFFTSLSTAVAYDLSYAFAFFKIARSIGEITLIFFISFVFCALLRAIILAVINRSVDAEKLIVSDFKAHVLNRRNLRQNSIILTAVIFFFATFTTMKTLIPHINPFSWDVFFSDLDHKLHFGVAPWELLQPIIGNIYATKIIAFLYILWLWVIFAFFYWQLFYSTNEALKMRYFYSVTLVWSISGTLLAIIFASTGPCYYELITGDELYKPLMDYLYEAHKTTVIYALMAQEFLWENYITNNRESGSGITAFPSIHVSMAFLFVLVSRQIGKKCFIGFLAFFVATLVGSIHLGWHYAVDGYAAVILTWGFWWFAGMLANKLVKADPIDHGEPCLRR